MKKLFVFALASLAMLACTNQNDPSKPSTPTIEGELSGVFSVGASRQVHFAQGNLQYQASSNTWRFAKYQYETCGDRNENASATYAGWIDVFCYGTSGYNNMYPWIRLDYDDPTDPTPKENISGTNYDWGVYNKISNGGNKAGMWRTLTSDEWLYLFHDRKDAEYLFGLGSVNGINGVIILPDDWKTPVEIMFTASYLKGLDEWEPVGDGEFGMYLWWDNHTDFHYEDYYKPLHYADNTYSLNEWAIMESCGAVFLPIIHINNDNKDFGIYWSSSYGNYEVVDNEGVAGGGIPLLFTNHYLSPNYPDVLDASVRLARDVK